MKKLMYIIFFLIFAANVAAQEPYVIDSVCFEAERFYRVDGEKGSTYIWAITDAAGDTVLQSPGIDFEKEITPGNFGYGSELQMLWNAPGVFLITTIQYSIHGCDTTQQGYVKVFDPPFAFAGNDQNVCTADTVRLYEAIAEYYSRFQWTTLGDGVFEYDTLVQPKYIPGIIDNTLGSVSLILTVHGLADNETCIPSIDTINIKFNNPVVTLAPTHLLCYNDYTGKIIALVSGNEPFTFEWTGPDGFTSSNDTILDLAAGWYKVKVTDNLGCDVIDSVEVTQPEEFVSFIDTLANVTCYGGNNGMARVTVSGGTKSYFYFWNSNPVQYQPTAVNLSAGTYTVIVTDDHGCETTETVVITQPDEPLALSADSVDARCLGQFPGSVDLTVTGGTQFVNEPHYLYQWSDENGVIASTEDITGLAGDMLYTVVVTDSLGCLDTLSIFINVEQDIKLTVDAVDSILCFGGTGAIYLTISDGLEPYTVLWDSGETTEDLTNIPAGDYHITVTDANGCSVDMDFTLYDPEELTADIIASETQVCEDISILLNGNPDGGTGIYIHSWTGSGAVYLNNTGIVDPTFSGAPAGTYNFVYSVTDENGCVATASISLEILPITYETVSMSICPEDLPLTWNDSIYSAAGTYTNIMTNVFGCDSVITFNLSVYDKILLTATTQNAGMNNQPTGSIDLTVNGGTAPFTFAWSNGGTTEDIANLTSGIYEVTVTDFNGCSVQLQVTVISEPGNADLDCPPAITLTTCANIEGTRYYYYAQFVAAGGSATSTCGIDTATFAQVGDDEYFSGAFCINIHRRYMVQDSCGALVVCEQDIFINDKIPPAMTCPPDLTITGIAAPVPYGTYAAYLSAGGFADDNCGVNESSFRWISDVSDGNTNPETITRTYQIADICGNVSTCVQLIHIYAETEVYVNCPPDTLVQCPEDVPAVFTSFDDFIAAGGSAGTTGNVALDESSFAVIEVSDGNTCPEIITRTYSISDINGKTASCIQTITVRDTEKPVLTLKPKNPDCLDDVPIIYTSKAEFESDSKNKADDNCELDWNTLRMSRPQIIDGICPRTIIRFYVIDDLCGNTSVEAREIIIIEDKSKPRVVRPPRELQARCEIPKPYTSITEFNNNSGGYIDDNCDLAYVKLTHLRDSIAEENCPIKIIRFYRFTDLCDNFRDVPQTIIVNDTIAPVISCPAPVTADGTGSDLLSLTGLAYSATEKQIPLAGAAALGIVVSDECQLKEITYKDDSTGICPVVVTRTFTVYDACGNTSTCAQTIELNSNFRLPELMQLGPFCINSVAPALPLVSDNGITGTWNPSIINTSAIGTFTYTFTPAAGQCAVPVTMDIEITDGITPVFVQLGPFCLNSIAPALPLVSDNGITGTWNPSVISTSATGTFTYTFTPGAGQCAIPVTMVIEITNQIIPAFVQLGPFCINSDVPDLPLVSDNGISGTWNPSTIETTVAGTFTYTFTPSAVYCAVPVTMDIEITDGITPVFASLSPQCPNTEAPDLPLVSENGITGTWNPSVIDTKVEGNFIYVFTPDPGQCAFEVTLDMEISDKIIPDAICRNITVYLDDEGKASITTAQINNNSYDNCKLDTLFLSRYDFDCDDVGINPVTLTAIDAVGLIGECEATVTVLDTIQPVVFCRGPFEIQLDENAEYTLTVAEVLDTTYDVCGIDTMYVYPYLLDCDHIGLTTITLRVIDVNGNSSYCETEVLIYGNRAPTVVDDSTSTTENVAVVIDVISNDYDEKTTIDPATLRISIKPLHGKVTINPENGDLTYTPDYNFSGVDVLQYSICDDGIPCEPECGNAFVFILVEPVNEKPVAVDDYYSAGCFSVSGNVLDNDSDPDSDNLTINTNPLYPTTHGELTIDPDGTINYYPNDGFIGVDSFAYVICDNGIPSLCDTATVYFDVDCSVENPDPLECELFIPEGFSPNEDGIHDFFRIMCIEHYPDAKLMIFNRNGNLLWEKEHYGNYEVWGDQYNAWWWGTSVLSKYDIGKQTINGDPKLKVGNYVYVLLLGNGEEKNGTVMVAY